MESGFYVQISVTQIAVLRSESVELRCSAEQFSDRTPAPWVPMHCLERTKVEWFSFLFPTLHRFLPTVALFLIFLITAHCRFASLVCTWGRQKYRALMLPVSVKKMGLDTLACIHVSPTFFKGILTVLFAADMPFSAHNTDTGLWYIPKSSSGWGVNQGLSQCLYLVTPCTF